MPRKLFVTTALPYANAAFHIGHMMEYIQADIWVRFQRMVGSEVHFVCADDAHGAPIMIAADKAGKTPQAFVAEIAAGRKPYLDGFHIAFDNWHSTDGPENHELAQDIYRALRKQGLIAERVIEQFFDPLKSMFLPDRYIKGECPKCGAKDQYGDNCDNCGAVYAPTELKNPYSALSGATPVLKTSTHYFFQLSSPRCLDFLQQWTATPGRLQPEVLNKIREWFSADDEGHVTLADWDISRDAPYFGIRIPDTDDKYFYVWLDAPVGYLASLKNYLGKIGKDYEGFLADPRVEQIHFIGKDIAYFHTLFWPAMLHFSGRKTPDKVNVHGFITLGGDKMSKSRGTGLSPLKYLEVGLDAEWLRYYIAAKLNAKVDHLAIVVEIDLLVDHHIVDHNLIFRDLIDRDLIDRWLSLDRLHDRELLDRDDLLDHRLRGLDRELVDLDVDLARWMVLDRHGARRVRHHHRHRARGGCQVHVLIGLDERLELGDHLDRDETGPLERLHQAITTEQQLLDLLAGQLTTAGKLAEHTLAIRTSLVDHLAALLLCHGQLGLGVGRRVGAPTRRLDPGLLPHSGRLVGGLTQHLRGGLFGFLADLDSALACGGQHSGRLFAEQPRQRSIVELCRVEVGIGLGGSQFTLEKALAFLESAELGGDHPQEVADFSLVEPAAAGIETGIGDRRRRRRVGAGE